MSASLLGVVFVLGAAGSSAVAWWRGPTMVGAVTKGTAVAFGLLAVAAFLA